MVGQLHLGSLNELRRGRLRELCSAVKATNGDFIDVQAPLRQSDLTTLSEGHLDPQATTSAAGSSTIHNGPEVSQVAGRVELVMGG